MATRGGLSTRAGHQRYAGRLGRGLIRRRGDRCGQHSSPLSCWPPSRDGAKGCVGELPATTETSDRCAERDHPSLNPQSGPFRPGAPPSPCGTTFTPTVTFQSDVTLFVPGHLGEFRTPKPISARSFRWFSLVTWWRSSGINNGAAPEAALRSAEREPPCMASVTNRTPSS